MLRLPAIDSSETARRVPLLTPRNLLILSIAALGTHQCIPVALPAMETGSPPSFVAFIAIVAVLDRAVAA